MQHHNFFFFFFAVLSKWAPSWYLIYFYRLSTFATHHIIVLYSWPILLPLKLPSTYPHLSINSRLCGICPIFSVRRFYVMSAAVVVFRSAALNSGSKYCGRSALGPDFFTSSIRSSTFPSNSTWNQLYSLAFKHMNFMTFVPAAGWQKDPWASFLSGLTNGIGHYWKCWSDRWMKENINAHLAPY